MKGLVYLSVNRFLWVGLLGLCWFNLGLAAPFSSHVLVYTLRFQPAHRPIPIDGFRIYGGTSTEAPCSDLTERTSDYSGNTSDKTIYLIQRETKFDSGALVDAIGPELTCMRLEIDYAGIRSFYDSGDVHLSWDPSKHAYTHAEPSQTTADFTQVI